MADGYDVKFNWEYFLFEVIFKSFVFLGVVIWQTDKYGSLGKAYSHWNNEGWWFAPLFWIYMIIWVAVGGVVVLIIGLLAYDYVIDKIKQLSKVNNNG